MFRVLERASPDVPPTETSHQMKRLSDASEEYSTIDTIPQSQQAQLLQLPR
jgi:hypothetical protein